MNSDGPGVCCVCHEGYAKHHMISQCWICASCAGAKHESRK